jgi:hypothetical protein
MSNYKVIFDEYVRTVFQLVVDIRFWKHFMDTSIDKYQENNPDNRWIHEAGFAIYNIPLGGGTWLHTSKDTKTIEIDDLPKNNKDFFTWIMNLSLVRVYNSLELLLAKVIRIEYFPGLDDPGKGRKEINKIYEAVKSELKSAGLPTDVKNQRHLIEFLKWKSPEFNSFLQVSVNPHNWKTNWKNYFEWISILRNIITHQEMLVTPDVRNDMNSIAGDMLKHYFEDPIDKGNPELLQPREVQLFLNFLSHINDFAGNTLKYVSGESDMNFIGLSPA